MKALIFCVLALAGVAFGQVSVESLLGRVIGKGISGSGVGFACDAFLGIPFAKPPTGDLRFRKTEPVERWTRPLSATQFKPQCIQMPPGSEAPQSEDCLYLNIVRPSGIRGCPLPVMVWIHGGGFVMGDGGLSYPSEEICANFAPRNVIVVTIQYRLGYLGFLATNGMTKGNYGLWDQVQALRWVQDNIEAFGGDPKRVTIFGESAGGSSVAQLTYAPVAEGLFSGAIAQSGSALTYWATGDGSVDATQRLLDSADCTSVACLRRKSVAELQAAEEEATGRVFNGPPKEEGRSYIGGGHGVFEALHFAWAPRVDGDLLPGEEEALELLRPKPFLIGATAQESLLFLVNSFGAMMNAADRTTFYTSGDDVELSTLRAAFNRAAEIYLEQYAKAAPEAVLALGNMTEGVYLDQRGTDGTNKTANAAALLDLVSDIWLNLPMLMEARQKAEADWPVFLYSFEHRHEGWPPASRVHLGATHGDDLYFLFNRLGALPPVTFSANDDRVRELLLQMWTNFARNGKPTGRGPLTRDCATPTVQSPPLSFDWDRLNPDDKLPKHLKIIPQPFMSGDFHSATLPFWQTIASEFVAAISSANIIRISVVVILAAVFIHCATL